MKGVFVKAAVSEGRCTLKRGVRDERCYWGSARLIEVLVTGIIRKGRYPLKRGVRLRDVLSMEGDVHLREV